MIRSLFQSYREQYFRSKERWWEGYQDGMTLLEILVVMVILGLLATLGSIQLMSYLGRAKGDVARLQLSELATAIDLFHIDIGRVPATDEGLLVLVQKPSQLDRWRGPYLRKEGILKDPWGRAYIYKSPGEQSEYELISLGADGAPGGTDENQDVVHRPNR